MAFHLAARPGPVPVVMRLAELAGAYQAILSDIWGVLHNGVHASAQACDALVRARASGLPVILISNAPRPAKSVQVQLDGLKVPREAYDGIVTSGDVTRNAIEGRPGVRLFHLGPPRDRGVFEGLDIVLVDEGESELIVNTGFDDDESESPDDYRPLLQRCAARKLEMICANPDIVVERGDRLVWCAGALAELYEKLGGRVVWAGKPHPPIYERALALLEAKSGRAVAPGGVLAIGDSLRTDLAGAARMGLDALFVAEGIHGAEAGRGDALDLAALETMFSDAGLAPRAVTPRLAW